MPNTANRRVARLHSASTRDRATIMATLAAFPEELGRALGGLPPEAVMRPARDGGWGAIENLCHLHDWEEIYVEWARAIVAEDRPPLPAFDDELWEIERDYRGQDPARTFERFRELRERQVAFLSELPEEAWARVGVHDRLGEVTLRWVADHVCDHDGEHLAQVRDALG